MCHTKKGSTVRWVGLRASWSGTESNRDPQIVDGITPFLPVRSRVMRKGHVLTTTMDLDIPA